MKTYTETEAKTKFCTNANQYRPTCAGSQCMAWVWERQIVDWIRKGNLSPPKPIFVDTDKGYCGLIKE